MSKAPSIKVGDVFPTNQFGTVEVVFYANAKEIMVRFQDTGYLCKVNAPNLVAGKVRDKLVPSVCGVGYLDVHGDQKNYPREYQLWQNMIHRCYNPKAPNYKYYGERGVFVDKRWHSFERFVDDLSLLPGFRQWKRGEDYQLDSDMMSTSTIFAKHYSLHTCMFLPRNTNNLERAIRKGRKVEGAE
jgi:hypothetical protein